MTREFLKQFLTTLLIAAFGGTLFYILHLPLPWTLGALTAVALATTRMTPVLPGRSRRAMSAVLGVMLGSGFHPNLFADLGDWGLSIAILLIVTVIGALGGILIIRRATAEFSKETSYFMAMPGGLTDMATIGQEMGADPRTVALNHSLRIIIVVWTIPLLLPLITGLSAARPPVGFHDAWPSFIQLIGMAMCLFGWPLAEKLKLPAAGLMGPLLLSATAHLTGLLNTAPPRELVVVAQLVLGAWLGARFVGTRWPDLKRCAGPAAAMTAFLIILAMIGAAITHWLTGMNWPTLVLAYAPGGLSEMSLVALGMHLDASVVAMHHLIRVVLVLMTAPMAMRFLDKAIEPLAGNTEPPAVAPK